jgi:hypothetical protein
MTTKIVKMEKCGDCGPACLAMVLGCTLEEAWSMVNASPAGGVVPEEMIKALRKNGMGAIESLVIPHPSCLAILTVPSLNHRGLLHYIYWDGHDILDPTNGKLRYPDDGPVIDGERLFPQWASAILIWRNQ